MKNWIKATLIVTSGFAFLLLIIMVIVHFPAFLVLTVLSAALLALLYVVKVDLDTREETKRMKNRKQVEYVGTEMVEHE